MNIQNLETQYLKAKVAYYEGHPIMSDAAFDILEKELKSAGSKVIEQVGSKRKDFDFPHPTRMRSLAKFQTESNNGVTNYQEVEFENWLLKRALIVSREGKSLKYMYYSPKFDGSAINIIYKNGNLESVLTRGDGKAGKDVTDRFRKHLPATIGQKGVVEIRCEAVMSKSVFEKKYAAEFANARNLVAGIIGKDDFDLAKVADITLCPLHYIIDGVHQDIELVNISRINFPIFGHTYSTRITTTKGNYVKAVKEMEALRETFEYPLDGVVFSLPAEFRELLGENDHDPEWAIAIKFVPDEVVTPVMGVQWNLGKTGELTPVVILKPVQLAGTTVKRASGYNAGHIVNNKIGKGCIVSLAKAGDIIPEVQSIIVPGQLEELPSICPVCGEPLTFDGIHLMCNNTNCTGRIAKKLASACGMLDLKGIGGQTIEPFAEEFENIYELMSWVLRENENEDFDLELFGINNGSRSAEIFVNAFKNIKSLPVWKVILMMGYDGVGKKLAEQVAKEYFGLEADYTSMERALVEKMQNEDIKTYILKAISDLESLGVTIDKPGLKSNNANTVYICMTGSPKEFGWKTKEEFIKQFPNAVEVSVTDPKCNYLITDDLNSTSGKMKNAQKKGVKIVTYSQFKG